jgi:hypothetical protein
MCFLGGYSHLRLLWIIKKTKKQLISSMPHKKVIEQVIQNTLLQTMELKYETIFPQNIKI